MYVSKQDEKAIELAEFCRKHNTNPRLTIYAIACCKRRKQTKSPAAKVEWEQKATGFLLTIGFDNIQFKNRDWPTFTNEHGETLSLPQL